MEIWESQNNPGMIMRRIIIILEIITILLLLAALPGEQAKEIIIKETKFFYMEATAYYPGKECCEPWDNGLTFTGAKAGKGCVAIDPESGPLKLGQKVYVEGYGFGICNDIGAAITGYDLDLCYDTLKEAREWGIKLVKVYVLD